MTPQELIPTIFLLSYLAAVSTLVVARFKYFKIESATAKTSSRLYDLPATIHILLSVYLLATFNDRFTYKIYLGEILMISGIALFVWTIRTTNTMNFASSESSGEIITTGPYSLIRHPFYFSYSCIWGSTALVFNSVLLWITLMYLIAFYVTSAKREQSAILKSGYSREYELYINEVGMFFPRISQWKSWFSKLLQKKKRKI